MLPLVPIAIGAGMGYLKNQEAKRQENADRELAAATIENSPWTGMKPNPIRRAGSTMGSVFGGGVQGAMLGQSLSGMGGGQAKPTFGAGQTTSMNSATPNLYQNKSSFGDMGSPWEKINNQMMGNNYGKMYG